MFYIQHKQGKIVAMSDLKSKIIRYTGIVVPIAAISIGMFSIVNRIITSHTKEVKPNVIVAYSMDGTITNDDPFQLGYPGNRMDITCNDNTTKECVLEVETGTKYIVSSFPYVKQEWFRPDGKNRPYHTLDVIKTLPSYNGNSELKFGSDVKKNSDLVRVLKQNGWVE